MGKGTLVAELQLGARHLHHRWKQRLVEISVSLFHQVATAHAQVMRVRPELLFQVPLESMGIEDAGGNQAVVELEHFFRVQQYTPGALPGFNILKFLEQGAIVLQELVFPGVIISHQGVTDEHLARCFRGHTSITYGSACHQDQAEQTHRFLRSDQARFGIPGRIAEFPVHQVSGHLLNPQGLYLRRDAGPQSTGLHQGGGHHPARTFLTQHRGGEDRKACSPGTPVFALLIQFANMTQQSR
jgi:hypothetical protein